MADRFKTSLWINGGIVLGSFALFGGIFYFLSLALDQQVHRIAADRTAVAQRFIDLENLNELKARSADAAEIQKKIDILLPVQDDLLGFRQAFTALARNRSLALTFDLDAVPVPPVGTEPGHVDFMASVEGDAANIRGFLEEAETKTTKFMVNIQRFILTPSGAGYRADLKGQVFFQENKPIALPSR